MKEKIVMEKCGKIYDFGKKIGAELHFDGRRYCLLKLADGQELKFYSGGRIVVGDHEWTPPEIMLESIKADLKDARKCGLESDSKGFLEHFKSVQEIVQEYIQEIEEILSEPKREELEEALYIITSTFEYLSENERAKVRTHYDVLHKHCYGDGPIDPELVKRELRVIWDEIGSVATYIIDRRYAEEQDNLFALRQLAGLEEG